MLIKKLNHDFYFGMFTKFYYFHHSRHFLFDETKFETFFMFVVTI